MIIEIMYNHQEPACPPKLQDDTRRTGGVLTGLYLSELNETFNIGFKYISKVIDIFTNDYPVPQDSRMTPGGQVKS